mgnify:CR=1 FL=1
MTFYLHEKTGLWLDCMTVNLGWQGNDDTVKLYTSVDGGDCQIEQMSLSTLLEEFNRCASVFIRANNNIILNTANIAGLVPNDHRVKKDSDQNLNRHAITFYSGSVLNVDISDSVGFAKKINRMRRGLSCQ